VRCSKRSPPTSKALNLQPLAVGDTGDRVRELHERLRALGFDAPRTDDGVVDEMTVTLIEAFQRSRGLPITGSPDAATWQSLIEAGWTLGDRLLYLTREYLRGDDVADLQVHLAQLGFNPGRIDGVFGPATHVALVDFQYNCGLPSDGTLTRRTLLELRRVAPNVGEKTLVTDIVDPYRTPSTAGDRVVLWGDSPLLTALAAQLPISDFDPSRSEWSVEEFAKYVNASGASTVLVLTASENELTFSLSYWAGYHSHSRLGEQLASGLAASLAASSFSRRLSVNGMALPVLRETKMTTVYAEHGHLDESEIDVVIAALVAGIADFLHK